MELFEKSNQEFFPLKFAPLLAIMNSDILPLRSYFCGFYDLEVFMSLKRGSEPQAAFNESICRDSGRIQREVRKADTKKPCSFLACLGLGAAFLSFTHQIPRSFHHFGHCRSLGDMLMGIAMGSRKGNSVTLYATEGNNLQLWEHRGGVQGRLPRRSRILGQDLKFE